MYTVRGQFTGNTIELLEDAPTEGRAYVLVTFLDGNLEMAVARGHRLHRDVLRAPADYVQHGEETYARFTVGAIMTREIIAISALTKVSYATHMMREKGITSIIVDYDDGGERGIMTMRDVLKHIVGDGHSSKDTQAGEIATRPLITVSTDMSLRDCSKLMVEKNIRRAVVCQDDRPVGIISETDIFQFVDERGWGPEAE